MFARLVLAMIAMLLWSAVSCLAAGLEVGVYLRSDGGTAQPLLDAMRSELTEVLNRAGFRLKWMSARGPRTGPIEAEELIVVDFLGTCDSRVGATQRSAPLRLELASTSVVGSQILPFSSLDCATLNSLMSASLAHVEPGRRDLIYGRAMGRVLAHEFYHVLVHTHKHTAKGIAKSAHSAEDLIADRFDFDPNALAQLRRVNSSNHTSTAKSQTGPETPEGVAEPAVLSPAVETVTGRQDVPR